MTEQTIAGAAPQHAGVGGGFGKRLVLSAVGWSLLGYGSSYGLRMLSSIIMTRLLVPEMFGVMAVAMVVLTIVFMMCDVGLRQAVIRSPNGDQQIFLDTAWTVQIIRGFIIWTVCALCAAFIAWGSASGWFASASVYAAPELPWVVMSIALTSVILGFQSTKSMTSDRHFNQRQLTVIELISQSIGLVVCVAVAYATRSIWSFVAGTLVASVITLALSHFYLKGPLNRLRIDRACLKELSHFGRWVLLSSGLTVLAANGDRVMLANAIDPRNFGFYVIALNFVLMVEGAGGRLFMSVATASLSKIANENLQRIRDAYYRMRLPFDVAFIGSAGILFASADAIVTVLYDDRYADAGPILRVLSFSLILSRFGLLHSLYIAMGKPQYLGLLNAVKTAALFVLVPLCTWLFGFQGALWAIALHGLVMLPVIYTLNRRHGLNSLGFEAAILLIWPVGYAAGLALSTILLRIHELF